MVIDQSMYDALRRRERVEMSHDPRSVVEDWFEQLIIRGELGFASYSESFVDFSPHVGDDDDVLQGLLAAQRPEHRKVSFGNAAHPEIRDTVHVDDTTELHVLAISVYDPHHHESCCAGRNQRRAHWSAIKDAIN